MAIALTTYPTSDPANPTTESRWQNMATQPDGVVFGVLNNCQVYADSTGLQIKVKTGRVFIRGFYADIASEQIMAVASPDPSNNRIDAVVARLDLSGAYAAISLVVITGTPAGSPSNPTLGALDIPLAYVTVAKLPNGTIAAGAVTLARVWTGTTAWAALGSVTARSDDSNTLVDSSTTQLARYRVVAGTMQFSYIMNVFYHGASPTAVYFGLPNFAKAGVAFTAAVDFHAARGVLTNVTGSSDISWAQVQVRDLFVFGSAYNNPIANGFSAQFFLSGNYEIAG